VGVKKYFLPVYRTVQRECFGGETIMVQMVNLSGFMGCKPAQASTIDVSETGFLIPVTESC
jgi:hypothetical protein